MFNAPVDIRIIRLSSDLGTFDELESFAVESAFWALTTCSEIVKHRIKAETSTGMACMFFLSANDCTDRWASSDLDTSQVSGIEPFGLMLDSMSLSGIEVPSNFTFSDTSRLKAHDSVDRRP